MTKKASEQDKIETRKRPVTFLHAILPIAFLTSIILYGLIIRPLFLDQEAFTLEVIFILASFFPFPNSYIWVFHGLKFRIL